MLGVARKEEPDIDLEFIGIGKSERRLLLLFALTGGIDVWDKNLNI